jgi:hypothetical protein
VEHGVYHAQTGRYAVWGEELKRLVPTK